MSMQKKLKCEPCREFDQYVSRIESNGIYVSDLPPRVTEEEVHRFFSGWGQIADLYLADRGHYCLVHFEHRRPVDELVSYPVALFGKEISIRPRFKEFDKTPHDTIFSLHEEALKSISTRETFGEQVKRFLNEVAANEDLIRKQEEVCEDLRNTLKHLSKHYSIMPFGSSLNGLALMDSDIDIFYGKETSASEAEVKEVFRKVRAALERNSVFTKMKPIPNARVPIIKFVHKATQLSCDLSFRNTMGVQNSKLIKFIISLDDRIKPLFLIVKYWAKLHHITGKRMSNYALIMILINFLQSLQNPILPRLLDLQHNAVAPIKVDVWNAAFDDDVTRLRPISNDLPLEELLSRFFESVARTNFSDFVVCPLLGSLIHRDGFYTNSRLPPQLKNYADLTSSGLVSPLKVESVLCLQDPIELNHNVTKNVAKHDFQHFVEHCQIAARLSYSVPPHEYLSSLLSTSFEYPRQDSKRTWLPNPMHKGPLRPYLTLNIPSPENVSDEISWRGEVIEKIILIFKKILKIHVDIDKRDDTKPGSDQTLVCKGSQILWVGRDRLWRKWYSNKPKTIEVLDISDDDETTSEGRIEGKRKRTENDEGTSKRKKLELSHDGEGGSSESADIIVLDETSSPDKPRTIQEEINLTNNMVKQCHALPASDFILYFKCSVSKVKEGACIELSDHRSRNCYFSSLCIFLEDFLCKHLIPEEASFTS